MSEETQTYYQKNREKQLKLAKEYQDKNRDYYKAYNRVYYQKNKEKLKAKHKEYFLQNQQKIQKDYREKYYPKHYAKVKQEPAPPQPIQLSVVETMALPPIIIQSGEVIVSFQ